MFPETADELRSGKAAMATTFAARPAPSPTNSPKPSGGPSPPRRRQARRRSPRLPLPDAATSKSTAWLDEINRHLPTPRLIRLDSTRPVDAPFFTILNYDVRRIIYDTLLSGAGFHQHIFCPSLMRMGRAKELYTRYLVASECPESNFVSALACGHWECERDNSLHRPKPQYDLADLLSLMLASKFSYLEVSDHVYNSITFIFGSFREVAVFIDRTSELLLSRIRTIALIAHALPWDTKACYDFIRGAYFQTDTEDVIALLRRFTGLEKLDVNFFPSPMLAASTQLDEIVKPLALVPEAVDVTVRLPIMMYGRGPDDDMYLPIAPKLADGARFKLVRPSMNSSDADGYCKALYFQYEKSRE